MVLTHYVTIDLGGVTRGRGVWADPEADLKHSVGWVPVNQLITPFDSIAPNKFGSHGDVRLYADADTLTDVELPDGRRVRFVLCDIGSLDGKNFDYCARAFLKKQLAALESMGLQLVSSFEQEFWLNLPDGGSSPGFSLQRALNHEPFGSELMASLEAAGIEPEMLLPEFAPGQFELTLKPAWGIAAADRAVISREITRIIATSYNGSASFVPLKTPGGVGSGVHVHMSLWDRDKKPVTYDPEGTAGLSSVGEAFCAGIVRHMRALCAFSAPSVVSYERLQPHRWSSAYTCMGDRNREATLRICPVVGESKIAEQFNIEYRAADATANPYLVLGSLIAAGLDGLRNRLPAPPLVNEDPSTMDAETLNALGVQRLPTSLEEALVCLEGDGEAITWLGEPLRDIYLREKLHEAESCSKLSPEEVCALYAAVF